MLNCYFQTEVPTPKDHQQFLLDKGGAELQDLEKPTATATKITITTSSYSNDDTISGPKKGIEKDIQENRIISVDQSKQAYEVLQIPKSHHLFIYGPNVKKMLAEHPNVRVNIPPENVMKDEISVAGEKEGVNKVVSAIVEQFNKIVSTFFIWSIIFLIHFKLGKLSTFNSDIVCNL